MGLIASLPILVFVLVWIFAYLNTIYESYRKVKVKTQNFIKGKSPLETESVVMEYKQAPGPFPWPIIGNLAILGQYEVPFEAFTALSKIYGDAYSLTLGTTRCLVVNNLELIREVLNQNGKFFGGRPDFIRYNRLFGGDRNNSLALCDWSHLQQKRRNLARKHCSPRDASTFFTKMSDVGCFEMQEFMSKLKADIVPGQEYDLKPVIMQACANMFSQYMCSTRFDYENSGFQVIVRYFDEIFWEINQGYAVDFLPWLVPFYSKHMKKIVHWSTTIRKFILEKIIDEREQNIDLDEPDRDFTDALLRSLIEDNDVSRNTLIFMLEDFLGGHSAVGNLVMLALSHVVRQPEIGKRIQAEIDEITENGKRNITLRDTERMPYTVATIYEVLRYSSSPIVPHVATEDCTISGHGVTKGTLVFINNYELNTSEKYWDNPKEFDPDRFIEKVIQEQSKVEKVARKLSESSDSGVEFESHAQSVKVEAPKYEEVLRVRKNIPHFLPFSIGKRTCIGQNLVRGFGFITLANILQQYDVSVKDLSAVKTVPACVALPPDTFLLVLTERQR